MSVRVRKRMSDSIAIKFRAIIEFAVYYSVGNLYSGDGKKYVAVT